MIDRCQFTPDGTNPPFPVPISDYCTVPTMEMASLLAELVLGENAGEKDILEIGTGSGFQAAVLAERCRSLVSIDVRLDLGLAERLPAHVAVIEADGYEHDTGEQFDGVLVTFGASHVAAAWVRQTKVGGRLVVPLQLGSVSRICLYERTEQGLDLLDAVAYAPFTPGVEA